jgi:hypothetical protein
MRQGSAVDDDYRAPDLGPCCHCEVTGPAVVNIMMLPKLSPIPGRGWGCLECNTPLNGATAVLCTPCLESHAEIKFACRGWPGEDGRVLVSELHGTQRHNEILHLLLDEEYQAFWERRRQGLPEEDLQP